MRIALFICVFLAAIPAAATEPTVEQCDSFIAAAFKISGNEEMYRAFTSPFIQNCFRRFPELHRKYFPVVLSDKHGRVPPRQEGPDPNFPIRLK